jgi:GGDEF domain-containing protein
MITLRYRNSGEIAYVGTLKVIPRIFKGGDTIPGKVVSHGLSDSQLRELANRVGYTLEESQEEPPFAKLCNVGGSDFLLIIKNTTKIRTEDRLLTLSEAWEMHINRNAMLFPE